MYEDYRFNPEQRPARRSLPDTLYYEAPCKSGPPDSGILLTTAHQSTSMALPFRILQVMLQLAWL